MKILHTADWHLGRVFHEAQLIGDQVHVLEQLYGILERERPDLVVIAGDIFDRAIPPPDAIVLLDHTLQRLLLELRIPLVMIPGNHDSSARLGFGAQLMRAAGLHLVTRLEEAFVPLRFEKDGVDLDVFALPYAEPAEVRTFLGEVTVVDHQTAVAAMTSRMREAFGGGRRTVLVAHAFVDGARTSESERPLSIGGTGTVDPGVFAGFDYVALGHLHAPQSCSPECHYAGSLLKYSFSEADHEKSVAMLEFGRFGPFARTLHPITALRNVRCIEGSLAELLAVAREDPNREDYLHVTLTDEGALLNALGRLREFYPNVLHLERKFLQVAGIQLASSRRREAGEVELFRDFCREAMGAEATAPETEVFENAWREVSRAEILTS